MCHILSKLWVNGVKIEFVCLKLTEKSENVSHFIQIVGKWCEN